MEGMEVGQREENKQGWGVVTKGEWRGDTSAGVQGGRGGGKESHKDGTRPAQRHD